MHLTMQVLWTGVGSIIMKLNMQKGQIFNQTIDQSVLPASWHNQTHFQSIMFWVCDSESDLASYSGSSPFTAQGGAWLRG